MILEKKTKKVTKKKVTDRKWEYVVLYSNVEERFRKFFDIYEKDREAARYYALVKSHSTRADRVVAFVDKNIHMIVHESIGYGVSTTLRMYKSLKVTEKYYVDISKGLISRYSAGKFIPCRPKDITTTGIRHYLTEKMPWIDFVFKLNLPVTFASIVDKKLYSHKKLLSWYWGTNYPTALRLYAVKKDSQLYNIKEHSKNIRNLVNINDKILKEEPVRQLFMSVLDLAVKARVVINAAWSVKRLRVEERKLGRKIMDVMYSDKFDEPLAISENFKPILRFLGQMGCFVPRTKKQMTMICEHPHAANNFFGDIKNKRLVFKYKKSIFVIDYSHHWSQKKEEPKKYHSSGSGSYHPDDDCDMFLERINKELDIYRRNEERKRKILQLEGQKYESPNPIFAPTTNADSADEFLKECSSDEDFW